MVDTMITLYESTAKEFDTNGLGNLPDALTCLVTEERNGEFELEMEYPITGKRYSELTMRRIIVTKSNPYSTRQAFRIYAISKPINGIVTINAEHISYDLTGYPVSPFIANTLTNAFVGLEDMCVVDCPFTFWTDKATTAVMTVEKPTSIRSLLGGMEGSILDVYGGEYEFDNFTVKLHGNRGTGGGDNDERVSIRYGKNLTDLKQEENCSAVYTGVYPFWYSEQDGMVELDEKVVKAEGTYNFTRIYPLDLSQEWTEVPTKTQLKEKATAYMKDNKIGTPKVSLTVSFIQLAQSEEYKDYAILENVHLCDWVDVEFPELGVSAKSKCISTTYNVLTDKYEKIELGDAVSNLASSISERAQETDDKIANTKTYFEKAVDRATKLITGGLGGYVILHSSTGGDTPDEILIMDKPDVKSAKRIWRWNLGGLGYSDNGGKTYNTAMTMDGAIVADFITAGTMLANRIQGGTLVLGGFDNASGTCLVKNSLGETVMVIDRTGLLHIYGDRTVKLNGGFNSYTYKGKTVGHIGTNHWDGTEKYGLLFDLDMDGQYIGLARKMTEDGLYEVAFDYDRPTNMLHAYCDLDMNNCRLKNVKWGDNGGITGTLRFVQINEVDSEGKITNWTTGKSYLKFENGVLVDANFYSG